MLRNTRWIVGLVLNTGPDTKIVMSSLEVTVHAFGGNGSFYVHDVCMIYVLHEMHRTGRYLHLTTKNQIEFFGYI